MAVMVTLMKINGNFEADYLKSHSYRKRSKFPFFL